MRLTVKEISFTSHEALGVKGNKNRSAQRIAFRGKRQCQQVAWNRYHLDSAKLSFSLPNKYLRKERTYKIQIKPIGAVRL